MGKPNYPCFEKSENYREYSDSTTTTTTTTTASPEGDFFVIPNPNANCPEVITRFEDETNDRCIGINDKILLICNSISYNPNPCIREVNKYIKVADISVNVDDCARYKLVLRDLSFPTTTTTTIPPT
jgi:hypothetical protein